MEEPPETELHFEHGIGIGSSGTHWHCEDVAAEGEGEEEGLSTTKAWGYTTAAVLVGSIGCVVILVSAGGAAGEVRVSLGGI